MLNVQITAETDNVERLLSHLDTAVSPEALARFLGVKIEPYIRARAEGRFNTEGDDVTGPWAPLAPATEDIRAQMGYGASHPINRRTDELMNYIVNSQYSISVDVAVGASLVAPGRPPTGVLKKKMQRAQAGDSRTPARPVIGMNEEDLAWVMLALMHNVLEGPL